MKQALLLIDYSNDFTDDKGSLSCGAAAQALDGFIAGQLEKFAAAGDFIFICNDQHRPDDPYDPEGKLFPPHNIVASWGAELYGLSGQTARRLLAEATQQTYYLPKTRYSAFFATELDALLRHRQVQKLTVVGLCTDICVLHTVIDACYLGYTVRVPRAGCAALTETGHDWALQHMQNCLAVEIAD